MSQLEGRKNKQTPKSKTGGQNIHTLKETEITEMIAKEQ